MIAVAVRFTIHEISGKKIRLQARERFIDALYQQDAEEVKGMMRHLVEKHPSLAPQALIDFLCHPNCLIHLKEMMNGANVLVEDESRMLFSTLTQLKGARHRHSSHPHQKGTSFGIATRLFGELLFWLDKQGKL